MLLFYLKEKNINFGCRNNEFWCKKINKFLNISRIVVKIRIKVTIINKIRVIVKVKFRVRVRVRVRSRDIFVSNFISLKIWYFSNMNNFG